MNLVSLFIVSVAERQTIFKKEILMYSLNEIRRMNKKSAFQRKCEQLAQKKYGKRLADLEDAQCSEIARQVRKEAK